MYLKRITITGFKSFANKTVINFDRGITGVVGPNGSGKSNLADAIRWALGEQGKGRLRLEGRDEVVFAGSAGRARASYAEVILLFDNESGAFGIDLTEVEISRRLYRSGESEYKLAGRPARLSDIQALLAGAGVGAGSYAVIGQGMIDSILLSSPAERKLLFEEAAGIRGPELGREAAQRKLTATAANLTRLRDIAAELGPRLGSLEKAVGTQDDRAALAARVAELRAAVIAARLAHWQTELDDAAARQSGLAAEQARLQHLVARLDAQRLQHERAEAEAEATRRTQQAKISQAEQARDAAVSELAAVRTAAAQATQAAELLAETQAQLKEAAAKHQAAADQLSETRAELASAAAAATRARQAVERAGKDVAAAQAALVALREGTADGARDQYVDHALQILKTLAIGLGTPEFTDEQVRLLVHKAGRLLSHATRSGAAELLAELAAAQKQLETAMGKREIAVEHQTNVSITSRSLEIDLAHQQAETSRLASVQAELESKLKSLRQAADTSKFQAAERAAATALHQASEKLEHERSTLAAAAHTSSQATAATLVELQQAQAALAQLQTEAASLAERQTTAETELAAAARQAQDWSIEPAARTPQEPLAVLADQLARAETLLEARTQQYADQLEEFQETSARYTEMTTQIADLEAAEADLTKLIAELDTLIRSRFRENFQALAEQYTRYFAQLFDGGQASLELSETEGAGYGITIKASPKGKRLASITALSGGERALAGVALIAAIMKVNPSPFVVLDEIDAALDESNSGRLAGILAELQQYSQLIVITHNRQTMKAADVLFGVTMNEHHVSHLISMRLEQATRMAAR